MRLNKVLQRCVSFAKFAQEHKLAPTDLAELIALAGAAFTAGSKEANSGTYNAEPARQRFTEKAASLGFDTAWAGLYPSLRKDGFDIYLP